MIKLVSRAWAYLTAALTGKFNEKADPKVQIEQAIMEGQENHRRLLEQATNVVANQKTSQLRLNAKMEELEKLNANARQAVRMADEAAKQGDPAKATQYTQSAEAFAGRLVAVETEVENLKQQVLASTKASDQAKSAVAQSSSALQKRVAEKSKLLSQLDQAKMQEQLNTTMGQLTQTIGTDVPTLDEVSKKIEERYAKAMAHSEIQGSSVESRMLEVEQASLNVEAQSRLSQIKAELGLSDAPAVTAAAAPAVETPGTTATA
jgi:phage shock protein A